MPPRLYLAGPMAGYPQRNAGAFAEGADSLRRHDYIVTSPAELHGPDWPPADDHIPTEDEYCGFLRTDLAAMLTDGCEGVALLDGWHRSRGANLEHTVARALGMTVEPIGLWLAAGALARGRTIPETVLRDPRAVIDRLTDLGAPPYGADPTQPVST